MGKWIPSLGLNPEFNPDQVLPCFSSSLHSFPLKTAMEKMKAVAWCTLNHLEHLTPGARIPSTPRCISICRSSCSRFRRSSFLRSLQKKSVLFFYPPYKAAKRMAMCRHLLATELLHFKLTLQLPLLLQELEVSLLRTSQKVHGNAWDQLNGKCPQLLRSQQLELQGLRTRWASKENV